jgi:hypothetical protein
VVFCCGHGNELFGSVKGGQYVYELISAYLGGVCFSEYYSKSYT